MYETLKIMGYFPYQLVQDFSHQPYSIQIPKKIKKILTLQPPYGNVKTSSRHRSRPGTASQRRRRPLQPWLRSSQPSKVGYIWVEKPQTIGGLSFVKTPQNGWGKIFREKETQGNKWMIWGEKPLFLDIFIILGKL